MPTKKKQDPGSYRLHLDRRAHQLTDVDLHPNAALTTREVSEWLGVSVQFLEICRHKGTGPKFKKISDTQFGRIRYQVADVNAWLEERTCVRTSEYLKRAGGR